ncbi:MAG: hypothetical protein L0220_00015 [Acidobacteria bacterium]|nr:hypothetical protein [Acidobacteriota bacterium]
MKLLCIIFTLVILMFTPAIRGQNVNQDDLPAKVDQNETMIDTLKKMQIQREENEHKKLLEKGSQIKAGTAALLKESSLFGGQKLSRSSEKKLKDMEKFAKQIRSDSGGSEDEKLDPPPSSLTDALEQLSQASDRLNENLAKTSRRVVSIAVVNDATEIIQLVKLLRGYLN